MTPRKINNSYLNIVENIWTTFKENHNWNSYASILALSAYERIGKFEHIDSIIDECVAISRSYLNGEVGSVGGAYDQYIYRVGGSATAWLYARGFIPEAEEKLIAGAERLLNEFPRSPEGAFMGPWKKEELIWIDSLFAVCPYLVWLGETTGRKDFTDAAIDQLMLHHQILFDPETKLYRQARKDGRLSAIWGRGVGWAVYAMAEMTYDLRNHERFNEVAEIYRNVIDGCLAVQDENGLFHQVLNDPSSYVESSGSGLILYGFGRGVKNQIVPREKVYEPFLRGIKGLTGMITLDGSVNDCCCGCLFPGDGSRDAYANHPRKTNDIHAAGAMLCAFGQAEQLYVNKLIPSFEELMSKAD